jgi:hypothetical protein
MPRFSCSECGRPVAKCMRRRKADGSCVCARCKLQGSKVKTELQVAKKERDLAAEKAKEAILLLKEEKKTRLQLEDKITQRLCRGGGYRLEGRDAGIIPDDVVAYELEVAKEEAQIEKDRVCFLSNKLQEERQEKKAVIREARAERANLLLDLTVSKSLQSQFQKVAKRKVDSSEKKAKDTSQKLVEIVALFSERLQEERTENKYHI